MFFIGLGLSVDAFSIAIGLGTMNLSRTRKIIISLMFGFMHFLITTIALFISDSLSQIFEINFNIFLILIFIYSGFIMIFDNNKVQDQIKYNNINILLLAFSVSVDSFPIGLGLKAYKIPVLGASLVFLICSSLATYLGLIIGECGAKHLQEKSPILGGLIFWILAFVSILKYF